MALLLLVEDERSIRQMVRVALEKDHIILEAPTGEKALDFTEKVRPNVILLDMNLQGSTLSGLQLLTGLRQTHGMKEVPVLVISGYAERDMISDAFVAGATKFLSKPYDISILRQMVNELVEEEASAPARLALRLTNSSRLGILDAIRIVTTAINGPETIKALKAAITQFDTPAARLEDAQNRGLE